MAGYGAQGGVGIGSTATVNVFLPGAGPLVTTRSAYLAQVCRIAESVLQDRDPELAEVRGTEMRSAIGMPPPAAVAEPLIRLQAAQPMAEEPIAPLYVRTSDGHVALPDYFDDCPGPLIAIMDFPLDIVDAIGRLAAGQGYGYCCVLPGQSPEGIESQLDGLRTLFVDFSPAALSDAGPPPGPFLEHVFRAAERAGVRCAAFLPRYLAARPYSSSLPDTPYLCESGPMFHASYARRTEWLRENTKVRRLGRPLDRLLAVNSDAAVRLVADFFRAQDLSGTLEVTPANPGSLDVLARLADLLARSRFYELAFRLERYCRTFQSARTDQLISANLHPREPGIIGLLRDAAVLPPGLDRAVLLSVPGGGKSTLLRQIDLAATVPALADDAAAPAVTFRIARSCQDRTTLADQIAGQLRGDGRAHRAIADAFPRVRLGDVFASRVQLLLDTDGVLRAADLDTLETTLAEIAGPPENTGYLLSVTNETPPAQRSVPGIELRRWTTAQIERTLGPRFREFLDLERYAPGLSDLLRSPFLLLALSRQPAGERLAIGDALGQVVVARLKGLPQRDEIYRNLSRLAIGGGAAPAPDQDWLADAAEVGLVVRDTGRVRFENTLIREYFLACALVDDGTPAAALASIPDRDSRRRVGVLCVDLLDQPQVEPFVRSLAGHDAVLAHTVALYASWRSGGPVLTAETASAVLQLGSLTALGPADPRIQPDRMVPAGPDFTIAPYPTTNWEFLAFVKDGGYARPEFWSAEGRRWLTRSGGPQQPQSWSHPERTAPNQPVRGVSFFEAEAYCCWLSAQHDNVGFWLPSAALWDLVAHGEQRYVWAAVLDGVHETAELLSEPLGADGYLPATVIARLRQVNRKAADLGSKAMQRYDDTAAHDPYAPIGTGAPNALGVYDLYGLCWQWCATSVDGADIEPFWHAAQQPAAETPLLVKGGTAGGRNLPAFWSFIGSWFMPGVQYDGIGFRTMSYETSKGKW
ncbi:SUMF1/EgtB/PvdO family nonheme iron enzyme [Amycolatopsis sp. NPDC058278]|uniref:SUMF1/EgtB/PvdO family nonheme iron enzyme n=1 Tax=Amycolatopsis sp. NPDC058278 TaxID=3346417 RepID=UPI0036DB821A